jgi:hypothetical protein
MPSRPRTQVIGWVSWDIPCILHSSIIKTKFLLFDLQVLQIPNEIAANALNIKRLENKNFWQTAPENENSRVSHTKTYIQ